MAKRPKMSAMARPAATSPAISTIPTITMSSSAGPWTRSRIIARAMATPKGQRARDAAIIGASRPASPRKRQIGPAVLLACG